MTCGFMLGPGNPNAAIASMFGTPKGFPPIWKTIHKHRLMKTALWEHYNCHDAAARRHQRTDWARMWVDKKFSFSLVDKKSYRCIRERRGQKTSSWQISRYSVGRRQQRQSFSLIWNWSCRRVKTGIRRGTSHIWVTHKPRKSLLTALLKVTLQVRVDFP